MGEGGGGIRLGESGGGRIRLGERGGGIRLGESGGGIWLGGGRKILGREWEPWEWRLPPPVGGIRG